MGIQFIRLYLINNRFRPITIEDGDLLSKLGQPRYFSVDEYDTVLSKVSELGYGLESVDLTKD